MVNFRENKKKIVLNTSHSWMQTIQLIIFVHDRSPVFMKETNYLNFILISEFSNIQEKSTKVFHLSSSRSRPPIPFLGFLICTKRNIKMVKLWSGL